MESLKTKILIFFMVYGLSLFGQSFTYSYIDPCTKDLKTLYIDQTTPIVVSYYGQVKSFTYTEVSNGSLDLWMNSTYNTYKTNSPCQGLVTTTTTTISTNSTLNIIGNVMSLTSMDFSSVANMGTSMSTNVGGSVNSGTNIKTDGNKSNNQSNASGSGDNSNNSSNSSNGEGSGSNQTNNQKGGTVDDKGNNQSNTNGSTNSSGSSNNGGSGSNGSGNGGGNTSSQSKEETKTDQKVEETKTEQQKTTGNNTAKATSKAKADVQKPAILVTGDIVGIQNTNNSQDARATMSFTRVKGDGTASLGGSVDYMISSKIGNFSLMRSWIGVKQNGNKHINVLSGSGTLLPGTWTSTLLFVRVNSLKNFTALYGAAGSFGYMYKDQLISTLAIGGIMYKGKLTKHLDATIIAAGIYSPYVKFQEESLFKNKPIIIPFINLNYKLSKTFGVGLTAGGAYVATQNMLNYQCLIGGKLIL